MRQSGCPVSDSTQHERPNPESPLPIQRIDRVQAAALRLASTYCNNEILITGATMQSTFMLMVRFCFGVLTVGAAISSHFGLDSFHVASNVEFVLFVSGALNMAGCWGIVR